MSTARSSEVGLSDVADDRVRGFSLGMRQRLGLAAALLTGPGCSSSTSRPTASTRPAAATSTGCSTRLAADGHRGRAVQPPDGRPGRAVLRGHHPRRAAGSSSPARWRSSRPRAGSSTTGSAPPTRAARRGSRARRRGSAWCRRTTAVAGPTRTLWSSAVRSQALDELVVRLVGAGVAIRELAPVVSPLEAAFLALTDDGDDPTDDAGPPVTALALRGAATTPGPAAAAATASSCSS